MRRLSWIGQLRAVGWADLAGTVEIKLWKILLRDQELEGGKVYLCPSEDYSDRRKAKALVKSGRR